VSRLALLGGLALEVVLFAFAAPNFLTLANFFEVTRRSVEVGLLAVAMTPILVAGGIDLSVGSMMGLAAVMFGAAHSDWNLPIGAAAAVALLVGCAGGLLNAALIAGLNIPPLIVTLGSLSLFRGVAEGITQGAVNYSGFPPSLLRFGQGYLGGVVPAQLPVFLAIVAAYIMLLHRSIVGRAWYAIGFTAAGARYAGIPVARRVGLAYVLSGLAASVAAIVYVAHLGQARADAGTGYELDAITAVVLGGTSVFGGRGSVWGTLVGLFAIAVLQNGLHLAALPSELTGVLVGALLISTIALDRSRRGNRAAADTIEGTDIVRNAQVAVLCATVIAGALIVAGTNVWMIRSIE
jgi:rhamnose transport system substrate-binding protein